MLIWNHLQSCPLCTVTGSILLSLYRQSAKTLSSVLSKRIPQPIKIHLRCEYYLSPAGVIAKLGQRSRVRRLGSEYVEIPDGLEAPVYYLRHIYVTKKL